jgi:cytohesin
MKCSLNSQRLCLTPPGWLWKQGGRYKTWKRRWFILNDNCLYYFEFTTDKEPRGIIPLENVGVREVDEKKHCFEIFAKGADKVIKACKTDSDGRVVEGKHSVYRMMASDDEEKANWLRSLTKSISYSPFYELLGGKPSTKSASASGGGGGTSSGGFQK